MRSIPSNRRVVLVFFVRFVLAVCAFFALYSFLFGLYSSLVSSGAELLLTTSNPNLRRVIFRPELGIVGILFKGSNEAYAIPYNTRFVLMNLVIVLALVVSVPGLRARDAARKSAWAFLITAALHMVEVAVDLGYATTTLPPAAQWVPYSKTATSIMFEISRMYAHMGMYIAPFLIWFGLCHSQILGLPVRTSASAAKKDGLPSSIGRNDPCPCGSGKKYKACCGK